MPERLPGTAYVVLGLVAIRPTTGHELAGFAGRSIGNFFPVTRSHVYSELDRLCRLGLLDATEVAQERAPTKRVYAITPEGTTTLDEWLTAGELPAERERNMFLVHIFFGDRVEPERLAALLDAYEQRALAARSYLEAMVERLADRPHSGFRRATAMFGLAQAQAKLAWLAEVRPLLLDPDPAAAEPC